MKLNESNGKSNEKVMIIHLIVEYVKNLFLDKMSYFPEPYTRSKNNTCWYIRVCEKGWFH